MKENKNQKSSRQIQKLPKKIPKKVISTKQKKTNQENKKVFDLSALFDRYDDELILKGLAGESLQTYVYSYTPYGSEKVITQLSKIGVDMACRELAKTNEIIRELDLQFQDMGDDALFIGKCGRYKIDPKSGTEILLDTKICQKLQWKFMLLRKGGTMPNKFWFEQGGQKCMRNGRRDLIPADFIAKLIKKWIDSKHALVINENEVKDIQSQEPKSEQQKNLEKAKKFVDEITRIKLDKVNPNDIINFGVYAGRKWRELPLDYLIEKQKGMADKSILDETIKIVLDMKYAILRKAVGNKYNALNKIKSMFGKSLFTELTTGEYLKLIQDMKKFDMENKKNSGGKA